MSVRRRLLAALRNAVTPVTVGAATATAADLGTGWNCLIHSMNPASATGFITTVSFRVTVSSGTRTIAFFSINAARTSVTGISASVTAVSGQNDYTGLSFPINVGDYIGYWCLDADKSFLTVASAAGGSPPDVYYSAGITTKPTPGTDLSTLATSGGRQLNLQGVS